MEICFLSSNTYKINEVKSILNSEKINIIPIELKINEIQSDDMEKIVKDKVIKAFKKIKKPIFVEQTGLLIKNFGDLPGGLTQIFWDNLKADKFSEIFSKIGFTEVTAKTVLAFCDQKKIYTFEGIIEGNIIYPPRGDRSFQWDCVFIPNGYEKTFAEMGKEKNNISMRKIALNKFKSFLEERMNKND